MTTPKIVEFKTRVSADCVERLEELLALARTGDIQDVAACSTRPDGSVITLLSKTENSLLRLAAVSRLLHRMHESIDECIHD